MARKKAQSSGPPEWIVTFADLMSLLLCFFILIVSFSVQDQQRAAIVAGSMRDAFGIIPNQRRAGIIEVDGTPTREHMREVSMSPQQNATNAPQTPQDDVPRQTEEQREGARNTSFQRDRRFATATATLRQAWMEMPEIAAISQNIILEETQEGLEIRLVDQDHRAMFPDGSRFPFERTRVALQLLAPVIQRMPNQISVVGHTAARRAGTRAGYTNWELSADRANAVRQILNESGLRNDRVRVVSGRADTDPLFPQDPAASPNSRVTITLLREAPPLPAGVRP
jgi:chemotaxis protein MotB